MSLKPIFELMDVQEKFEAAVAAKMAYWDASSELERELGFDKGNIPDSVSDVISHAIENFACCGGVGHGGAQYLIDQVQAEMDRLRAAGKLDEEDSDE